MIPSVLILVSSDPASSPRPAEAVRIAAGVGTWKKADVRLYLHGPAIAALGEWVDHLQDDDHFTRYLPIATEGGRPVLVEAGHPAIAELGATSLPYEEIGPEQLSDWVRRSTYTFRF
jgi:hypothetical protein